MTTVYVVTSGSYSDYRVDAMFSTQEKAEKYIARRKELYSKSGYGYYDDNGVQEWEIDGSNDDWLDGKFDYWVIWFTRDSADVISAEIEVWAIDGQEDIAQFEPHPRGASPRIRVIVMAESRERAVKVAMERRAIWLAAQAIDSTPECC